MDHWADNSSSNTKKKWSSYNSCYGFHPEVGRGEQTRSVEFWHAMFSHIQEHYPHLRLIVEPHTAMDHPSFDNLIVASPGDQALLPLHTSLVLTLGGDGTILHVSNLFSQGECPPVLSFSMGSLGFLLPFRMFLTLLAWEARTDELGRYQCFVNGSGEYPQRPCISVKQNAASM